MTHVAGVGVAGRNHHRFGGAVPKNEETNPIRCKRLVWNALKHSVGETRQMWTSAAHGMAEPGRGSTPHGLEDGGTPRSSTLLGLCDIKNEETNPMKGKS